MAEHFKVVFGKADPDEFYGEDDRLVLDEEFQERVIDELGEMCDVKKVYSEAVDPPYAVFRAAFSRSSGELYEKFGSHGMVETVALVAEEVYGHEVTFSKSEGW